VLYRDGVDALCDVLEPLLQHSHVPLQRAERGSRGKKALEHV
jgi:hypothetical protein